MLKGQLRLIAGLSVTGELSTARPHARQQDDAERLTRSLTFKLAGVGPWTFKITRKQVTDRSRDRRTDQWQLEYKGSPGERVSLSGRTSVFLSQLAANRSRVRSRLKARVAVSGRLALSGKAEYDLFDNRAATASIGKVRLGGDIALSDRTTLHLVYSRDPKAKTARFQGIEGRISRLVSF